MAEAALHGGIAAALAFVAALVIGLLPIGVRPSLTDAGMTALIVFCVAAGHTAGIAAGRPLFGLAIGAIVGVGGAGIARTVAGRRR